MESKQQKNEQAQQSNKKSRKIKYKTIAKSMGLKSTLLFNKKLVLTSFVNSKTIQNGNLKTANIEKVTDFEGNELRGQAPTSATRMFDAKIDADNIELTKSYKKTDGAGALAVSVVKPNPAKGIIGSDYIGAKEKIEKEIFGDNFEQDNLRIQIGYNILDIKKILGTYINNIIYMFYSINRGKIHSDLIGVLSAKNTLQEQIEFIKNNKKPAEKERKDRELKQILQVFKNSTAYYTYFGSIFKKPTKNKDNKTEEYCPEIANNYNVLRIMSLVRQLCVHSSTNSGLKQSSLFDLNKILAENCYRDLRKKLDDIYEQAVDKINSTYEVTAANNLFILQNIFENHSLELLSKQYYRMTVLKEDNNIGVNVKKVREIIINNYLNEVKDKKYNLAFDGNEIISYRSKLYTVMNFILYKALNDNSSITQSFVQSLRENCNGEEGKEQIYNEFCTKIWSKVKDKFSKCLNVFQKESNKNFTNNNKEGVPSLNDKYKLSANDTDIFVKLLFFVCKFLDGKEINELMCSMISKFESIADLLQSAQACGERVEFVDGYKMFDNSSAISEQLRIAKNLASKSAVKRKRTKTGEKDSFGEQLFLDALALFNIKIVKRDKDGKETAEYINFRKQFFEDPKLDKYGKQVYKNGKAQYNHTLRNFIINNVLKSKWFFYVVKYIKPADCCKLVRNKQILKFVFKEIPDSQIVRYYKSIMSDNVDVQSMRTHLIDCLCNFSIDSDNKTFKNISEQNKTLFKLYLTVAYLITKSMVKVNTRFSIAFSMLERDAQLIGNNNDTDILQLTKKFVDEDNRQYKQFHEEKQKIIADYTDKNQRKAKLSELKKKFKFHYKQNVLNHINESLQQVKNENLLKVIVEFRNRVVHLNIINEMASYLNDIKEVNSYYALYCYCVERDLAKICSVSDYFNDIVNTVRDKGEYRRSVMWLLNIPFAYNLARYKNLSDEYLYYDRMHDNKDE